MIYRCPLRFRDKSELNLRKLPHPISTISVFWGKCKIHTREEKQNRTNISISHAIFGVLMIYLYAIKTKESSYTTLTENVIIGASSTVLTTISETNTTLLNLCNISVQLAMPLVLFLINGTAYGGSVFASKNHFTVDNKTLIGLVLLTSSGVQIIMICSTVYIRNISDITQLCAFRGALTLVIVSFL